jgi:hypothetical protein
MNSCLKCIRDKLVDTVLQNRYVQTDQSVCFKYKRIIQIWK